MDEVFAKIADNTVKFNLGDEKVTDTHPAPPFLSSDQITPSGMA
jgi:hypothetical protein